MQGGAHYISSSVHRKTKSRFTPTSHDARRTAPARTMLALPALHRSTEWRETSFRSMAARDWGPVEQVIFETVSGVRPLPGDDDMVYENCLIPLPTGDVPRENQFVRGQRVRHTWALTIAYSGCHFSGYAWQKDAPKPTVAGCLQDAIEPLLHGEHSLRLACAGRTDAGVSALAQRVSFWCWPELDAQAIASAVAAAAPQPGALRVLSRLTPWTRRTTRRLPRRGGATRTCSHRCQAPRVRKWRPKHATWMACSLPLPAHRATIGT